MIQEGCPASIGSEELGHEFTVLLQAMSEERAACERLLALNADERGAIISGRTDELALVVEEKERQINLIRRLEGDCSRLTGSWARTLGVSSLGPRLERLLPLVGPDQYNELATMSDVLKGLARQVADGNRSNSELLVDFLRVTRELLHGLVSIGYGEGPYSSTGQPQSGFDALASVNCRA